MFLFVFAFARCSVLVHENSRSNYVIGALARATQWSNPNIKPHLEQSRVSMLVTKRTGAALCSRCYIHTRTHNRALTLNLIERIAAESSIPPTRNDDVGCHEYVSDSNFD